MIWSLTFHNSRHINIEKDTTCCTADLQKSICQMDQLCWEMCNRECGEGLMDVESECADIEKV